MSDAARAALALDGDCLVVQVPLRMKRRGGRKEVIVPGGVDSEAADQVRTNRSLAVTVARAHRWQELLESGRYASIGGLARDVGVDNCYLARMLRLTLLGPDIIEAILNGTEPDGLSLEKLYQAPTLWEEQRQVLGWEEQLA